jgi:hypothetical protein
VKIICDILPQKNVMKVILSLFAFLICFFIMNVIIVSITGYAKDDAFYVISEQLSGSTTLAETGRGIGNFVGIMFIMWDGIVGLIGAIGTYYYLADRLLDLLPYSVNGDE